MLAILKGQGIWHANVYMFFMFKNVHQVVYLVMVIPIQIVYPVRLRVSEY